MKINNNKLSRYIILLSIPIYLLVFVISVSIGSVNIPFTDVFKVIFNKIFNVFNISDINGSYITIILSIRLPRVLMASIVGASLSIAGAVMQGILKNPLADGSTLGSSSGASIGATIAISLGISLPIFSQLSIIATSMLFSFLSIIIVMFMVKKIDMNMSNSTVILSGVIFSMVASSVVSLIITIFSNDTKKIVFWTLGSFASSNMEKIILILPIFILCLIFMLYKTTELNVFQLGEKEAKYLGVNVKKTKFILLLLASALVGMCVSMTGNIGFVGLIIPNITRMIVKTNYRYILPFCCMFGASFLTITDLVSRTIVAPSELPIGVVTSLFGAIIFIYILYKFKKEEKCV